jgi:hypothetical protein
VQQPQHQQALAVLGACAMAVPTCPSSSQILAEYIWLGASGADLRSRTVVLDCLGSAVEELPIAEIESAGLGCEYEGAGEVYLQPKKVFPDPFRGGRHVLVLCDTYVPPMVRAFCSPAIAVPCATPVHLQLSAVGS